MKIEGKEFIEWLHEMRKKSRKQELLSRMSEIEQMRKIKNDAEKIIGYSISNIEAIKKWTRQ